MHLSVTVFLLTAACVHLIGSFKLDVFHTNDIHARYDERGPSEGGSCSSTEGECYGGMARHATFFKKVREQKKADDQANIENNYLTLSGGDWFSGTLYYTLNRGAMAAHFLAALGYDALAFGNHEFDNGVENLVTAMSKIPASADVKRLAANMNVDAITGLYKDNFMVKEFAFNGVTTKVGVIGYTTPDTAYISSPGPHVTLEPVVGAVRRQVEVLKKLGVNVIVAVGHAGVVTDRAICDEIGDVDIVVGGHTNTFLANAGSAATFPDGAQVNEAIEGPYPLVRREGKCVVVQAHAYGKFIGSLTTEFDAEGQLTSYSGDPVLMWGNNWPQDSETLTYLEPFIAAVKEYGKKTVGSTGRDLDGTRESCRVKECEMGNLVLDAFVDSFKKHDENVVCGLSNAGGIRAGIAKGNITYEEVITVLPFENTVSRVSLSGDILKEALEHGVSIFNSTGFNVEGLGTLLHVSGLKVYYDLMAEVSKRVIKLLILDPNDGQYKAVQPDKSYDCVTTSFLLGGGDGYEMLLDLPAIAGIKDSEVLSEFIELNSPLDEHESLENMPSRMFFDNDIGAGSVQSYCIFGILFISLSHIV